MSYCSLDRESENIVKELIRPKFKDWTVLVVTHQLQTVVDFDKGLGPAGR